MTAESGHAAHVNGAAVHTYPVGYCQKYVRDPCWRVGSLYGSAIDAWNGARHKHPGDRQPPEGAPCYYAGGSYGHAVISTGHGIRSTDSPSSGQVNDQPIDWPERAWGYTYLGWTEDLNGVLLPNLTDDDQEDDDMQQGDEIQKWSPDDGNTGDTTVGKTLNQARGYAEDAYQRVRALEKDVAALTKTVDKIAKKIGA